MKYVAFTIVAGFTLGGLNIIATAQHTTVLSILWQALQRALA